MNELFVKIQNAANIKKNASEYTHSIYRYPASMSPFIAREIITNFTKKDDIILDPFCGGGTTAIEGVINGRKVICSDLNSLACFITQVKSTPLSLKQITKLNEWKDKTADIFKLNLKKELPENFHIPVEINAKKTFWLLNKINQETRYLRDRIVKNAAKLIILRVGKYCYDCRIKPLNPHILLNSFLSISHKTLNALKKFSVEYNLVNKDIRNEEDVIVLCDSANNLPNLIDQNQRNKIKLILTSPPYPGIHILYHRWQIKGRKQTSLPYNLMNLTDGLSTSQYCLGSHSQGGYTNYYQNITEIFSNLKKIVNRETIVAQIVAFKETDWQLPMFLEAMELAGYRMLFINKNTKDIITREVPNRKWYTNLKENLTKEYVLFHKLHKLHK